MRKATNTPCEKVACRNCKTSPGCACGALVWGPAKALFSSVSLPTGDKELIQEVLFDAVVSAPIEAYWTSLALNKSE